MECFSPPNLPVSDVAAICAENSGLCDFFENIIFTKQIPPLPLSMQYHADLQICHVDKGVFVCAPECFDYYNSTLSKFGCKVLCGSKSVGGTYGDDCAYNVLVMGKYAFHNTKYTDEVIKKYFEENNIELVNIKQGYTKCAAAPVCENALITPDPSIIKECEKRGIRCLKISWEGVTLTGFSHGFFGGCCGRINEKDFYICGDLATHPEEKEIRDFILEHGKKIIEGKGEIIDFGSVMVL